MTADRVHYSYDKRVITKKNREMAIIYQSPYLWCTPTLTNFICYMIVQTGDAKPDIFAESFLE